MAATNGASTSSVPVNGSSNGQARPDNLVVMLDNYDSFTWNLYQYLCLLGANVQVIRSEEITVDELAARYPALTHLIISPGPGHPLTDSGISIPAIKAYAGKVPILGVCMGLQCLYAAYGGDVDKAGEVVHGKTSAVQHDGKGLFTGATQGIQATRYHSLAARITSLPQELVVTSRTESGVVMGIRHKEFAIEAVQYHPESILSEEGKDMLSNFLSLSSGTWADNRGFEKSGSDLPISSSSASAHQVNGVAATLPSKKAVPTILEKIYAQRVSDVARAKGTPGFSQADLNSLISLHVAPPLIDFHARLKGSPMALLAEVKRASPSKGDLVDASAPSSPSIALSYAVAGASVISVLTEPKWFKGSLDDMRAVRLALDSLPNRPAVLRKDFILDVYQIDEARVWGADTVLLIVAMLSDEKLAELYKYSVARGMEPLVEVNNAEELARAMKVGAKVIGVNNRNLHDFEVDMSTTTKIADVIKANYGDKADEVVLIALSGIMGRKDVEKYAEQGVKAILVGESLMRSSDKGAFVRELLGTSLPPAPSTPAPTLVKICGLKTPAAALAAAEAGADFLGLIFVEGSKRRVSLAQAHEIISTVRAREPTSPSTATSADSTAPTTGAEEDWFAFQASRLKRIAAAPKGPLFVGVFQNAPLATVLAAVDELSLDLVQLHGSEPAHWARLIPVPVIRAFHVDEKSELDGSLGEATRAGFHAIPLLDTAISSGLSGGAGKVFDWSVAARLAVSREKEGLSKLPIVLAGGLDADNVTKALDQVSPFAVDVSGGVETDGAKDEALIRAFVKAVKEHASGL